MKEISRRKFLSITLLSSAALPLTGCFGPYRDMTVDELLDVLEEKLAEEDDFIDDLELDEEDFELDDEELSTVSLALTYPAGRSPNVFTEGWIFGAKCIVDAGTEDERDISEQVRWSGSGKFNPSMGRTSRPAFESTGTQTITISIEVGGQVHEKTVSVNAVSPLNYAYVGCKAENPADAHGCPACPHPAKGPIINGSPNVLVNGLPAARVGDSGVHAACCGPNTYTITGGDHSVLINGRPAARRGDPTQHCGGAGTIIEGFDTPEVVG